MASNARSPATPVARPLASLAWLVDVAPTPIMASLRPFQATALSDQSNHSTGIKLRATMCDGLALSPRLIVALICITDVRRHLQPASVPRSLRPRQRWPAQPLPGTHDRWRSRAPTQERPSRLVFECQRPRCFRRCQCSCERSGRCPYAPRCRTACCCATRCRATCCGWCCILCRGHCAV